MFVTFTLIDFRKCPLLLSLIVRGVPVRRRVGVIARDVGVLGADLQARRSRRRLRLRLARAEKAAGLGNGRTSRAHGQETGHQNRQQGRTRLSPRLVGT